MNETLFHLHYLIGLYNKMEKIKYKSYNIIDIAKEIESYKNNNDISK
jgi:hypothetical protein